ncbi:MAG TPA: arsenite methyltransferase [Thermomicrobiales bacterium]|nr:arsenite methyltransferase [Thermomicrobiales bacterium]
MVDIKEQVRERYASAARRVTEQEGADCGCGATCCAPAAPVADVRAATGCCGDDCCGDTATAGEAFGSGGYSADQLATLPQGAVAASLGCGNPTALIDLYEGQAVLDLGSGGGIDVLLSARRVGPTGRAIGLDMTDEMLALARRNAATAGVTNVEFVKGEMEDMPLPDGSVDVVISNCVVNLSPDKDAVLRESFRVLRPGGRFAISDVIAQGQPVPPELRADLASWTGCLAGALEETAYRAKLAAAGFTGIEIVATQVYTSADAADAGGGAAAETYDRFQASGGRLASAFVRATKPAR